MTKTTKAIGRPRKNQTIQTNSPLRRMRQEADLSQEELAKRIGVSVSTIRRWERGQAEPTFTIAQTRRFAQAVGKSFEELPDSLLPH